MERLTFTYPSALLGGLLVASKSFRVLVFALIPLVNNVGAGELRWRNMYISRRSMMLGTVGAAVSLPALMLASPAFAHHEAPAVSVSPQTALERLRLGNRRHQRGETINKSYAPPGSKHVYGQWPFVALLSCSDSRVDPEDVFDLSAGNLFVVRVAGNVVDDDVLGSLENSVEQ